MAARSLGRKPKETGKKSTGSREAAAAHSALRIPVAASRLKILI
jgi:hypothetical protein